MMRRALILMALLLCTTLIGTTSVAASTAARTMRVKLYFIAENDDGKTGIRDGCNDSLVAVTRTIQVTTTPLEDTLKGLLSVRDQYYERTKLYNPLYRSKLKIVGVSINKDIVHVSLNGKFYPENPFPDERCEFYRVLAQLKYTSLQFSRDAGFQIYINGVVPRPFSGKSGK